MIIFHSVFLSKPTAINETLPWQLPPCSTQLGTQGKERDKVFGKSASPTSDPELLHVNFSVIGGKIFGPCFFCAVVQVETFSLDHVIYALAPYVVITRTQTINRAWNFEGLVNMVQESAAIDWLKAFTPVDVFNTFAQSLVDWNGRAQGQETHTESWPANMEHFRAWLENEALKKQTNCN